MKPPIVKSQAFSTDAAPAHRQSRPCRSVSSGAPKIKRASMASLHGINDMDDEAFDAMQEEADINNVRSRGRYLRGARQQMH